MRLQERVATERTCPQSIEINDHSYGFSKDDCFPGTVWYSGTGLGNTLKTSGARPNFVTDPGGFADFYNLLLDLRQCSRSG